MIFYTMSFNNINKLDFTYYIATAACVNFVSDSSWSACICFSNCCRLQRRESTGANKL